MKSARSIDGTPRPVLLTGFEPFGSHAANPSWAAAAALDGARICGYPIVAACLPVSFAKAPRELRRLLLQHRPRLVLSLGVSAQRQCIALERIAINLADASIPDNEGVQPMDAALIAHAPTAYRASVPLKAMAARLREHGYPVEVSDSAGTYVCNAVFYVLMRTLQRYPGTLGGFIHVPPLAPASTFTLDALADALSLCLQTALGAMARTNAAALAPRSRARRVLSPDSMESP